MAKPEALPDADDGECRQNGAFRSRSQFTPETPNSASRRLTRPIVGCSMVPHTIAIAAMVEHHTGRK